MHRPEPYPWASARVRSCNPPSQTSQNITIGTPDANGAAANSAGSVRFSVWPPSPLPDEADFSVELTLSDIRCGPGTSACGPANDRAGADYTGQLQIEHVVRLTDKSGAYDPTTVQDFTFRVPAGCSATSSTATGSTCSANTSANAVVPGSLREGRRSVWAAWIQVRVFDGGADGAASTQPNSVFMTQGIFVP